MAGKTTVTRKLAAILVADAVGSSRRMEANEIGALERLHALLRDVAAPLIAEHCGRIFKQTGDGFLAEFGSSVAAVTAALAIQEKAALQERSDNLEAGVPLRIGVHTGDVVVDGDDLRGSDVNIAARLEKLAPTGGICISDRVYQDICGKLDVQWADGGDLRLDGMERPIRVFKFPSDRAGSDARAHSGASTSTSATLLDLVVGDERPFVRVEPCGVNLRRTVRVKILNTSAQRISDGRLHLDSLDPPKRVAAPTNQVTDYLLKGDIAIEPHGSLLVDVAYLDQGTSEARPGTSIGIPAPPQAFSFAEAFFYYLLPLEEHRFRLRFDCEQGMAQAIHCRLWVDETFALRLADLATPTSALRGNPSGRLDIVFRENERRFDEARHKNLWWQTRCLSVAVQNTGARGLSNCQLYFDGISSPDGNLATRVPLCDAPFLLNASEERFVKLVSFEEREQATAGYLHVPMRPDGMGGDRTFDALGEHEITLRATAAECAPCIRHFRFWVAPNHRLRMAQIEP